MSRIKCRSFAIDRFKSTSLNSQLWLYYVHCVCLYYVSVGIVTIIIPGDSILFLISQKEISHLLWTEVLHVCIYQQYIKVLELACLDGCVYTLQSLEWIFLNTTYSVKSRICLNLATINWINSNAAIGPCIDWDYILPLTYAHF